MAGQLKEELKAPPAPAAVCWSVFIAVFMLVVLTAAIITFILPESYRSSARVLTLDTEPNRLEGFHSEAVLTNVVEALNLEVEWGRRYIGGGRLTTAETVRLLKSRMELRTGRGLNLVEIRVLSEVPTEAAAIANAMAEAYRDNVGLQGDIAQPGQNPVRIVEKAVPGLRPVRPNKPLNLMLGVAAGLLLGAAAGGLVAWLASRFSGERPPRNPAG